MNGWQRIGVVAFVIWAVVAIVWVWSDGRAVHSIICRNGDDEGDDSPKFARRWFGRSGASRL
jgi:hypothetical protein